MKTVLRAAALVVISAVLGMALLVGVYALPTAPMRRHVADSAEIFSKEGGYHCLIEGWHATMLDNFTDTVMLLTAIGEGNGDGLLRQAVDAPRAAYKGGDWLINHIDAYVADGMPRDATMCSYLRYWHGYLLVLKPLLLIFDYAQIRLFNMIAQSFLVLLTMYLLAKRAGMRYAVALTAAIVCLTPFAIPLSMQFSNMFYVTMCALIILLSGFGWLNTGDRYLLFFCLVGIVTNYFDFLTYPIITLGLPLCVFLLLRKDDTVLANVKAAAACCVFWGAGYAAMWASKWAIASAVTGSNAFMDAYGAILDRTSLNGVGMLGEGEITRIGTIRSLIALIKRRPYLIMAAGIVLASAWLVARRKADIRITADTAHVPSWPLVALTPFAWYLVLPNHSYVHFFFTYRGLAVTVFALLCCFFSFFRLRPESQAIEKTLGTDLPPAGGR